MFKGRAMSALCKIADKLAQRKEEYGNSLSALTSKLDVAADNLLLRNCRVEVIWRNPNPREQIGEINIDIDKQYDLVVLDTTENDYIVNYTRAMRFTLVNHTQRRTNYYTRGLSVSEENGYITSVLFGSCNVYNWQIQDDGTIVQSAVATDNNVLRPILLLGIKFLDKEGDE